MDFSALHLSAQNREQFHVFGAACNVEIYRAGVAFYSRNRRLRTMNVEHRNLGRRRAGRERYCGNKRWGEQGEAKTVIVVP